MTVSPALLAYRGLLFLYPPSLREQHGERMSQLFEVMHGELRGRPAARIAFVTRAYVDVFVTAPSAWRFERRTVRPRHGNSRARRRMAFMSTWKHDAKVAFRMLVKQPTFTLVAASTLALGIGANTAIFSVVYGVLMRPLGIHDAASLMLVQLHRKNYEADVSGFPPDYFNDLRRGTEGMEPFAGFTSFMFESVTLQTSADVFEIGSALMVDGRFFETMGASPILGRLLSGDDVVPNRRGDVCVIGETLWRSHFGADPELIGRTLMLDEAPVTVVGVLPAYLPLPSSSTQMWMPQGWDVEDRALIGRVGSFVRLSDPDAIELAKARLAETAELLGKKYSRFEDYTMSLQPFQENLVGNARPAILLAAVAAGLILLIACANTANLTLSRAAMRGSEVATRKALGARSSQLASQLMMESLALAALGGAFGVAVAFALHRFLLAIAPSYLPRLSDVRLDLPVLVFTALVSVLTGILFGFAPLTHLAGKRGFSPARRLNERGASGRSWIAEGLVVCQVGLSVALLIGAALMVRSLAELRSQELGFDPTGVAGARIYLDSEAYGEDAKERAYFEELIERLEARPEIDMASASSGLPLDPATIDYDLPFRIPGDEEIQAVVRQAFFRTVTPRYLETMRIPLLSGRAFDSRDRADTQPVALINETFAGLGWPGADPLGRSFSIYEGRRTMRVIGVVADVHFRLPASPYKPEFFAPHSQMAYGAMTVVARSRDPELAKRVIADVALELDRRQPVNSSFTLASLLASSLAPDRFLTLLLVLLGSLALLISSAGIYGSLNYWVSQSRRDLGVRMALGAGVDNILALVLRRGFEVTALGLALGAVLSLFLARLLTRFLFEVSSLDALALTSAVFVLSLAAATATLIPAWRAAHLDPMRSLRVE